MCLPSTCCNSDHDVMSNDEERTWLEDQLGPDEDADFGPGWLVWLRNLYREQGPLPRETVGRLAQTALVERADAAGGLVARDVRETLGRLIDVSAMLDGTAVRTKVDGVPANGVLMSIDPEELLVEVADAVQEIVMDDCMVWPECPYHKAGLHPELHGDAAVWVCRVGTHTVASIGHLSDSAPRSPKAAKRLARRQNRR
jgi:hypothetical protein